jgi:hypothetical protein
MLPIRERNEIEQFFRENLLGYLDLFSFVTNPPYDLAETVDYLLNLVFQNPKLLRYRDFYRVKTSNKGS